MINLSRKLPLDRWTEDPPAWTGAPPRRTSGTSPPRLLLEGSALGPVAIRPLTSSAAPVRRRWSWSRRFAEPIAGPIRRGPFVLAVNTEIAPSTAARSMPAGGPSPIIRPSHMVHRPAVEAPEHPHRLDARRTAGDPTAPASPPVSTVAAGPLPLPGRLAVTMTGASATVAAHRVIATHPPLPARTAPVIVQTGVGPAAGQGRRSTSRHPDRRDRGSATPTPAPIPSTGGAPETPSRESMSVHQRSDLPLGATPPSGNSTTHHSGGNLHQLALRQMIPHQAAGVVPATAGLILRAPAAPPVGTPRRGAVRIPDSVADAGHTRRPPPVPASVATASQASQASTASTASRASRAIGAPRASLLDMVPVSLFERARAGLASPAAPGGLQPPHPADAAPPVREPFAANLSGSGPIRRFRGFGQTVSTRSAMTDIDTQSFAAPAVADALTPREWDELVDLIVERLEDRVRDELARRGRRFSPGVF